MKNVKMKLMSLVVLTGLSIPVLSQNLTFEDFDRDDDFLIEESEFEDVFTDEYSKDWNNNDDKSLDDEDFYTSTFRIVDEDNDEFIDADEWDWGYDYYYGDYIADDFGYFDYNDDDYLDYTEYYDALYGTDYYYTWDVDRDTQLSQDELANAVFENWDINNSGVLSKTEYYNFDVQYLDI